MLPQVWEFLDQSTCFHPPLPPGPCFLSLALGRPLEGPSQDCHELIHLPGTIEQIGSNK